MGNEEQNCYTYLIRWSKLGLSYYGVRYAKKANPIEFWKKYFTSSKIVHSFVREYGDPDVIQIRNTFGSNPERAKLWEDKVLRRLNVKDHDNWLNRCNNDGFKGYHQHKSWNEGLSKENCPMLKDIGDKISSSLRKKYDSGYSREYKKHSKEAKMQNSFRQLSIKNDYISYAEFAQEVYSKWIDKRRTGVFSISQEMGIDENTVKRAIINCGEDPKPNQSWTRIINRYPDFPFQSYEEFCDTCLNLYEEHGKFSFIEEKFGLSYCTIQKSINVAKERRGD